MRNAPNRRCLLVFLLAAACAPAALADAEPIERIRERLAAAGDAETYNSDTVIVLDAKEVTVAPDGIGTAIEQQVVKILRDGGIRAQSVQRINFDPNTNRIRVIALRVHRASGEVEELPLERVRHQPDDSRVIYWGNEQFVAALPRLAVGDAVETIIERTGFNVAYLAESPAPAGRGGAVLTGAGLVAGAQTLEAAMPGHWHDEVHFWSSTPIIEKRYVVRTPKDKPLQFEVYNGELRTSVTLEGDHIVYAFEKRDIPVFRREPSMVNPGDVAPKLLLATLPDWESKSRWLYEANETQFERNDALREKVRKLIADCRTDDEKIYALNRWVADSIRYVGTSRGPAEGYTTHTAIETFTDRGGVCKDKAGILTAMLREAGFESYVAMTLARQEVFPVPADQFNHCVTVVRHRDGAFELLDPTWMPRSRDNWSTFEPLQHVVYGTPEGHGLLRSDYVPPTDNEVTWESHVRLLPDGQLRGSLSLHAVGGAETLLRRVYAGRSPEDRTRAYEDALARVGSDVRVVQIEAMDPLDFSGPKRMRCEYFLPRYSLGEGPRRYFRLPMARPLFAEVALSDLANTAGRETRTHPILLRTTRLATVRESIQLPPGWRVEHVPVPVSIDGPAASLEFTAEAANGELHYTTVLTVKTHRVLPEDYADYKKVMDAFDKLASEYVVCVVESASASK